MQLLTIAGTIHEDAAVRTTQGGDKLVGFKVFCSNGKDRDGNWRDSTWYDCTIFGKRATEAVAGILRKGGKVTVYGRPTVRVHEGRAYLGLSVNDFTLQGGGDRQEQRQTDGYGAGGRPGDLDDAIPFNAEKRI